MKTSCMMIWTYAISSEHNAIVLLVVKTAAGNQTVILILG